jgi:hypothetical protein
VLACAPNVDGVACQDNMLPTEGDVGDGWSEAGVPNCTRTTRTFVLLPPVFVRRFLLLRTPRHAIGERVQIGSRPLNVATALGPSLDLLFAIPGGDLILWRGHD